MIKPTIGHINISNMQKVNFVYNNEKGNPPITHIGSLRLEVLAVPLAKDYVKKCGHQHKRRSSSGIIS